jgi:hypothetical protein
MQETAKRTVYCLHVEGGAHDAYRCCGRHVGQGPGAQWVAEGVRLVQHVRLAHYAHDVRQLLTALLSDLLAVE